MGDIELVIKIDEAQKQMIDAFMELPPQVENDLISAIRHGTPDGIRVFKTEHVVRAEKEE